MPPEMFKPQADFLLTVHGDSMIDVGIMDGDLLAVHQTTEARNGQIVVARVDDEVTVKRLQRNRNRISLVPENADYEPIDVDLKTQPFAIEGLAVGVVRRHIH